MNSEFSRRFLVDSPASPTQPPRKQLAAPTQAARRGLGDKRLYHLGFY